MPNHAEAWHKTMAKFGFTLSREEAYMHEGRTGAGTINIVSLRERGHEATEEEIKQIYQAKSELFNQYPLAERMPGALEVLTKIKEAGLTPMVVTGSGQTSLLDRLNKNFPNIFQRELMVTAFDVKYGKPNPEPYLMALKKGGLQPNEAIVVENAPLGVQAGVAAGIFTIAVNTGPLPDEALLGQGANLLFHSMPDFNEHWSLLQEQLVKK
jgi:HAD superfamily hydrolase (TIGR01509 family)